MCVMRRKEVDLLFGVSRTCTAQTNKDWHWSNDNQRHKHPPKSWVEATANYTVHISLLAGIDHSGIYRIAVYSWLNPRVGKMKGFSYIMNDYLKWMCRMGPSSLLWNSLAGPARKKFFFGRIIDPLLTKPLHSRWLDIMASFFIFHWSWSIKKKTQKRTLPISRHFHDLNM